MRIIDTHCHATTLWYEPVESLVHQMDQNAVERAVLVQIKGLFDNDYLFECEKRYPGRFVSVVGVDTRQPDAPQQLQRLAERGARGIRLAVDVRSPGGDPLAIWRTAAELGLPVTCTGSPQEFASDLFSEVVEALPELPLIVEHLGLLTAAAGTMPSPPLRRGVFDLARYPNVYLKFHGLGEICRKNMPLSDPFPFDPAGLSLLHQAAQAFGPTRMMWGSDYPPVSGREGYANALRFPLAEFAAQSEDERANLFGGVAARVYSLD